MIHGPGGCDRSRMKNSTALGSFPIDIFSIRLFVSCPLLMAFSIEIEDVALALTTGDGNDTLRFDQPFQHGVLGCPQQGRQTHVILVSDRALFPIGKAKGISLFQLDLVGLIEKEVIWLVDLIVGEVCSGPSDAFQANQFPSGVSTEAH